MAKVGRRVERLLYFGSILLVFSFLTLYFSTAASSTRTESISELRALADAVKKDQDQLLRLFQNRPEAGPSKPQQDSLEQKRISEIRRALGLPPVPRPPASKSSDSGKTYAGELEKLVDGAGKSDTISEDVRALMRDSSRPPAALLEEMEKRIAALTNAPVTVWGISSPRMVPMSYGGATYQVPAEFVGSALVCALAPLLIGWVTALYITRQQELVAIRRSRSIHDAFPHVLNVFPVDWSNAVPLLRKQAQRRKNRRVDALLGKIWCSTFRSLVLLVFSGPATFVLAYSGARLMGRDTPDWQVAVGILLLLWLAIQTLGLIGQEWMMAWDLEFYA